MRCKRDGGIQGVVTNALAFVFLHARRGRLHEYARNALTVIRLAGMRMPLERWRTIVVDATVCTRRANKLRRSMSGATRRTSVRMVTAAAERQMHD